MRLGIDYIYVDSTERAAYPNAVKFETSPERFVPVFRNAEVAIYQVKKGA
jgi:uncharacterized membrane protein